MSTKRKGSEQAAPDEPYEVTISRNKRTIDRSISIAMRELERENALLQESACGRVQRVLKIYRGLKPLFTVLISLPLFPSPWRAALFTFSRALEAVTVVDLRMEKEG
ncbi:MAG TPA: hypothetical protein VE974_24395 [Thermoanaerobaculia bacterium]|nr:hypothetical protein [Thermoanaerobaculia bacterium]